MCALQRSALNDGRCVNVQKLLAQSFGLVKRECVVAHADAWSVASANNFLTPLGTS